MKIKRHKHVEVATAVLCCAIIYLLWQCFGPVVRKVDVIEFYSKNYNPFDPYLSSPAYNDSARVRCIRGDTSGLNGFTTWGRPLPSVFFYHLILADKYGYHRMFNVASADLLDLPDNYDGDSLDAETEKLALHYKRMAEENGKH